METKNGLSRGFGFWVSWFVVFASMVGMGILTNTGPVLKLVHNPSISLWLWGLGGFLALCGALTLAEMGSYDPRTGGDYSFVREAFGEATGFTYGWAMVIFGFSAAISLLGFTAASYFLGLLKDFLPWVTQPFYLKLFASLVITSFAFFHTRSHHHSAYLQNSVTFFHLTVLLTLACWTFFKSPQIPTESVAIVPLGKQDFSSLGMGFILVMYAYTGWNASAYLAGEVRNPRKNLPLSLGIGCFSVALLYLILNFAYNKALSLDQVLTFSDSEMSKFAEMAFRSVLGEKASKIFSLLISVGVLSSLSALILTGPRIVFAMSKDKLFPAWGGRVSEQKQLPTTALWLQCGGALFFLWTGTFEAVLNFASFGLSVLGTLIVAPIFILRRKANYKPTFRVPLYPLPPILFLIVNTSSLVFAAKGNWVLSAVSLTIILAGYPLYFILRKLSQRSSSRDRCF